jgi:hypothetical protein
MINSRTMRWVGYVANTWEKVTAYGVVVEKPEGKRQLGRPRRRWNDNIKNVSWRRRTASGWVSIGTNRGQRRAIVYTAMSPRVP